MKDYRFVFVCALVFLLGAFGFAAFNATLYSALKYTTAINVTILQSGMPMVIFILNFLLFRMITHWAQALGYTITLAGVVVNSSIVMIDSVHQAMQRAGRDEQERTQAMIDALVGRLRPILVTSLSTLGGVLPTAYGLGGYDVIMSPMSLAILAAVESHAALSVTSSVMM